MDLEEELKVIGENLKALEVAEEKAQQREEEYKRQIKSLNERLKTAESRYVLYITRTPEAKESGRKGGIY